MQKRNWVEELMDQEQHRKRDRAPYETPVLKSHGDAQALTQFTDNTRNMNDNRVGINLKT
jgi:hypothetical protein